jgi:nucleoside-diphosphate-sugar epimerase
MLHVWEGWVTYAAGICITCYLVWYVFLTNRDFPLRQKKPIQTFWKPITSEHRILVTGGAGVLGWRVATFARDRWPDADIVVFDIAEPPPHRRLEDTTYIYGDISDPEDVNRAFVDTFRGHKQSSVKMVFHVAGLLPSCATTKEKLMSVNNDGAKLIVDACRRYLIGTLVATSSASVVMPRNEPSIDGPQGEDMPYPAADNFVDEYAESKARGEEHILSADNQAHYDATTTLRTCIMRPSIIYAADDAKLAERLLQGEINNVLGDGNNTVDFAWADDVAMGHVQAAAAIHESDGGGKVAGVAYHLSLGKPTTTSEFYRLSSWHNPAPVHIPIPLIFAVAFMNKLVFDWIGHAPIDHLLRPDSLRFMAGRSWWFSAERATLAFGYKPTMHAQAIEAMRHQSARWKAVAESKELEATAQQRRQEGPKKQQQKGKRGKEKGA